MNNLKKIILLCKYARFDIFLYKALEKIGLKNAFTPGFPYNLMIEPANVCNLSCPTCPTGSGKMNRPKRMMNLEEFRRIIDQAKGKVTNLTLFNYGEPFLNKDILEMIKYAVAGGMFVTTSTNGQFFSSEEFCRQIIESGLNYLIIAIDGADQETIAKFRKGVEFDKILAGFNCIIHAKREFKSRTPIIELQFIVMKHNQHQREYMKQLARKAGFDVYCEKCVWIDYNEPEFQKMAKEFLPGDLSASRYYLEDGSFYIKGQIINRCSSVDLNAVINSDGSVVPCCYDIYSKYIMGNVFQEDLKDIWKNKSYTTFRKQIKRNRKDIPICCSCPQFRYTIRKKKNFS